MKEKLKGSKVPNLRFPGFEELWIKKKLSDISTKINSGKTPLGGEAMYTSEGIIFIRSQNVNNDRLELGNTVCISEETNEKVGKMVF
jgi:type I restriction enzyme S subunit